MLVVVDLALDKSSFLTATDGAASSIFIDASCFVVVNDRPKDGDTPTVVEWDGPVSGALEEQAWEFSRWWTRYGSGFGSRVTGIIPFVDGFNGDLTTLSRNKEWYEWNDCSYILLRLLFLT